MFLLEKIHPPFLLFELIVCRITQNNTLDYGAKHHPWKRGGERESLIVKNIDQEHWTYCKPSSVWQVDATNFASTKVIDEPVDGGVNVLNAFIVSDMEQWDSKLDAQFSLQVCHHWFNGFILKLHTKNLSFFVIWTSNMSHDDWPVNPPPPKKQEKEKAKTQQDSTAIPRVECMHASSEDQTLAFGSVCKDRMPGPSLLAEVCQNPTIFNSNAKG
jgi:hypothetical protein